MNMEMLALENLLYAIVFLHLVLTFQQKYNTVTSKVKRSQVGVSRTVYCAAELETWKEDATTQPMY